MTVSMTAALALGLGLTGTTGVLAQSTLDPLQNLPGSTPYETVRGKLLAAGWRARGIDAPGCNSAPAVCHRYPETEQCWTEDGGESFCAMQFEDADPLGSELRIIVLLNSSGQLTFHSYDEQAKGGRG